MSQTHLISPARKAHAHLTPDTWAKVRIDYERGVAMRLLSDHYGPTTRTIARRAAAEGWKRPELYILTDESPPSGDAPPAVDLDDVVERLVADIVSHHNDGRSAKARIVANDAIVYLRLLRRPGRQSRQSQPGEAGATDAEPAFRPLQDVFEFLAERGVAPEDVE